MLMSIGNYLQGILHLVEVPSRAAGTETDSCRVGPPRGGYDRWLLSPARSDRAMASDVIGYSRNVIPIVTPHCLHFFRSLLHTCHEPRGVSSHRMSLVFLAKLFHDDNSSFRMAKTGTIAKNMIILG